ncbi:MAG: thiamine pyrophosphate-binding protein [Acidimicrobiales bacterium]
MAVAGGNGGEQAVKTLAELGMDTLFSLPGSHIASLLDAARMAGIRVISVRHEENAVLMAEGWALATGRPGFVAVTAGPGLANAMGGLAEANAAGAPVVVVAGRTAISKRGRGAVQDLDQLAVVARVTKWSAECLEPQRIAEYLIEAVKQATWGSPGVAYLEIPEDVLASACEAGPAAGLPPVAKAVPDGAGLAAASQLLKAAQRPLILAGSGAFFSGAAAQLTAFIERTGIPVTTTSAARGLVDDDHRLCLGTLVHGGAALVSADLALVLGSRFNANLMYGQPPLFADDQVLIQADIAPEHLGGQRSPSLGLVGDVGATLGALTEMWDWAPDRWSGWVSDAHRAAAASQELWDGEAESATTALHAGWLARQAAQAFEELGGGTWISDGGDSVTWGIAFSKAHLPGSNMLIGSAMGTLGVGLPFAIGAGLAHPSRPVCLFTGDGAFGFSLQELHTAARNGVGMVVVVVNNGVWRGPGTSPAQAEGEFDYSLLAAAVGGWGVRVASQSEFQPALRQAFELARQGRVCLIDAKADPRVVSNLLRSLDELGLM